MLSKLIPRRQKAVILFLYAAWIIFFFCAGRCFITSAIHIFFFLLALSDTVRIKPNEMIKTKLCLQTRHERWIDSDTQTITASASKPTVVQLLGAGCWSSGSSGFSGGISEDLLGRRQCCCTNSDLTTKRNGHSAVLPSYRNVTRIQPAGNKLSQIPAVERHITDRFYWSTESEWFKSVGIYLLHGKYFQSCTSLRVRPRLFGDTSPVSVIERGHLEIGGVICWTSGGPVFTPVWLTHEQIRENLQYTPTDADNLRNLQLECLIRVSVECRQNITFDYSNCVVVCSQTAGLLVCSIKRPHNGPYDSSTTEKVGGSLPSSYSLHVEVGFRIQSNLSLNLE